MTYPPKTLASGKLAGKRVAYDLEVKAIKKKIEPEMNDEFAKELGSYESLDDFKQPVARTSGESTSSGKDTG